MSVSFTYVFWVKYIWRRDGCRQSATSPHSTCNRDRRKALQLERLAKDYQIPKSWSCWVPTMRMTSPHYPYLLLLQQASGLGGLLYRMAKMRQHRFSRPRSIPPKAGKLYGPKRIMVDFYVFPFKSVHPISCFKPTILNRKVVIKLIFLWLLGRHRFFLCLQDRRAVRSVQKSAYWVFDSVLPMICH